MIPILAIGTAETPLCRSVPQIARALVTVMEAHSYFFQSLGFLVTWRDVNCLGPQNSLDWWRTPSAMWIPPVHKCHQHILVKAKRNKRADRTCVQVKYFCELRDSTCHSEGVHQCNNTDTATDTWALIAAEHKPIQTCLLHSVKEKWINNQAL